MRRRSGRDRAARRREPHARPVRRVAGAQRGAVQPRELAGERVRVRHGGLHAATSGGSRPPRRARWCSRCARPTARSCPASRTRPWASSTRRRSPSWRRTPTARARWPAPAPTGSTTGRPGENVRLVRAGDAASADARVPTLVLTWADDPTQRTIGLQSATVDGIDAPGPADLDRIATLPELAVFPRDGLATAYLGFGTGAGLGKVAVRRALAGALDRDTLAG